jgi:hypothetical protein
MLVGQFAPVTIRLGEDGELQVHDPSEITIVPDVGLRVVCKAKLRWTVLGFAVPVTLDSLAVLLLPAIVKRGDVDVLVFRLEIEEADIAGLPTGIDSRITDIVNHELEAKHVELSWDYAATLNHQFDLPDLLKPVERLKLTVGGARVKASGESLALAIEFYVDVLRGLPAAASPPPPLASAAEPSSASGKPVHASKAPARWGGSAIVGGLAACAHWGAHFLGRARG